MRIKNQVKNIGLLERDKIRKYQKKKNQVKSKQIYTSNPQIIQIGNTIH